MAVEPKIYLESRAAVLTRLKTSQQGLTEQEAARRQEKFGKNVLNFSSSFSWQKIFFRQLASPVVLILFFAVFVSFFTRHFVDGFFILTVIFLSVFLGFYQEKKADQSLAKLRKLIKYKAIARRDGQEKEILAEDLVPGDIVYLTAGEKVLADGRLLQAKKLKINEAALTGEPFPKEKKVSRLTKERPLAEQDNLVFAGTLVEQGEGWYVVTAIGRQTELGKIASLVAQTEENLSPLQKQIKLFSRNLSLFLIVLNIFIFFLGVLKGRNIFEMFLTSVAVVVAAVPEGLLPAIVIILAIGMQKILKAGGLVKKMSATETLGAVSVICMDKTGTLTQGKMRVEKIFTFFPAEKPLNKEAKEAAGHYLALKIGVLASDLLFAEEQGEEVVSGDFLEKALYQAAKQSGYSPQEWLKQEKEEEKIPFSSEQKFMAVQRRTLKEKTRVVYLKGALEKILSFCSYYQEGGKKRKLTALKKQEIFKQQQKWARRGWRLLAVAYSSQPIKEGAFSSAVFCGLIAFSDPLRPEARKALAMCRQAGIRPVIITGDYSLTARQIAEQLGEKPLTAENILEGKEIDCFSDKELKKILPRLKIFARVEPRHKIRIVKLWQKRGEVVAMTGDGLNDAPALKAADIGLALGTGTDIAKETADIILLKNGFQVIVEAVRRGRIIFFNLRKVVLYLLTDSFTEMVLITGSLLFNWPLAVLPAQILWIKLIEDTTPAAALAFDEIDEGVMKKKPLKNKKLLDRQAAYLIAFFALIMDFTLLAIFHFYGQKFGDLKHARTVTFVGLGISSLFYIYAARGLEKPIWQLKFWTNKFLLFSTFLGAFLFLIAIYCPFFRHILETTPLGWRDWAVLLSYGFLSVVVYEIGKKLFPQV